MAFASTCSWSTDRAGRSAGLTPADFEIRDNGVLQKVDVVSFGEIPLSVALALDLSGSVAGARLDQLQRATRALAGALEKRDQSALLTFSQAVALRCPMSVERRMRAIVARLRRSRTARPRWWTPPSPESSSASPTSDARC